MIKILNIGMNHETAPVELRECLATDPNNMHKALTAMRELPFVEEALFISTCNRVETLCITDDLQRARNAITAIMADLGDVPEAAFQAGIYTHEEMDAVRHIFRVAASLDSMVVGEPQILGQIKDAYAEATRERMSGVVLNRLMHRAFHVAKRVRTDTGISEAAVSISYAAVELAKKIFHELQGKKALLIGAGEMAELAAKHLIRQGVDDIAVVNRTFERAVELAGAFGGHPVGFDEIEAQLAKVDIVLASTASSGHVITYEMVKGVARKRRNRPLFFIDIAVPRDVHPDVNKLENMYVYDIDDLKGIIQMNMSQRRQEAMHAERIVKEEVVKFKKWLKTLAVVPTIISLREKAEDIVRAELRKSGSALARLSADEMDAVNCLTRSIVEKVLHDPIIYLKDRSDRPTVNTVLDAARKLFNLDGDVKNSDP
ncbi:MAG: glutamyl-tRNA reductase [Deltaproteobacteria bacterium]|nr:glutamyl-tRNA reductase [Deltaproteobacteria bacterium]